MQRLLTHILLPFLLLSAALPAQGLQPGTPSLRSKRALHEVLQPSEAELSKRVTPVVRAVRATANSVINVFILNGGRGMFRGRSGLEGQGSGVIIDEKGLALTNWHVVALAAADKNRSVQVRTRDGKSYAAKVLSTSPEHDLALIQLELPAGSSVQPVTMGDSSSLMIGETVVAIGNPRGHQNTVTVGVLSAENRSIRVRTPDGVVRQYKGLLQTDAAINQGNSGGALLDITGKLIGINNAMSQDSENIGFAIPVNTVRRVFHEVLLSSENLTSVYLGMQVAERGGRVVLAKVSKRGPAWRSGLRSGDELLQIDKSPVRTSLDYARSLLGARAGQELAVTVRRNDKQLIHKPVPMSNAAWSVVRRIGLEFERVTYAADKGLLQTATRELYKEMGRTPRAYLPAVLRVTRIHRGSPAAKLGVQKGDVLLGMLDRVPDFIGTRSVLNTYASVGELNDSLHVMSRRMRNPEYTVWILRGGDVLDGPLEVPRL